MMTTRCALISILVMTLIAPVLGQEAYRKPSEQITRMVEAPPTPTVSISPDNRWMILLERETLPPLAEMAQPMERLAGRRLNPRTNAPHGPRRYVGLTVKDLGSGQERRVELPHEPNVGSPRWSPDGSRFAFTLTTDKGLDLWIGNPKTARARHLSDVRMNGAASSSPDWMADNRTLLVHLIDPERGAMPERARVPKGPIVQQSSGRGAPVRTYQDLLTDPHDAALYDYMVRTRLGLVDTDTGAVQTIGRSGLVSADPSPDGRFLLVRETLRPFSYLVPASRFPGRVQVWTLDGRVVTTLKEHGVQDEIPIGGVEIGPRNIGWKATADATLIWTEALDEGNPKVEADHRDRIMSLAPPFKSEASEIFRAEHRTWGVSWLSDGGGAMVSEYDRDRRWTRTFLIDPDGTQPARLVWDRSINDRYGDPGRPVTTTNEAGRSVVQVHAGAILLSGTGATPEGDRPFLDRMNLDSFATKRLWVCEGERHESVVEVLEPDGSVLLTRAETPDVPPNYYRRNLIDGSLAAVTEFKDPQPELRAIEKELVTYQRDDGVQLSATLYLPPGHEPGQRLPLIVWAYPREFSDPANAGQVRGSPYRFTRISGTSHLFLLLEGYAIMDGATMPVVGDDPDTVNDSFIDQIVASADAAIRFADERGVGDPERVAVGGHSYGAFMTANLLAHCDLFRAGLARSGAYNRTLTPFGFQSERRTFWEAPEAYFELSPFMHANKIKEPLLLIHGEIDNNSGTFPIQSERMYSAVKSHGGTVRLVMLPHESHGYRARESVLHVLAEMTDWLNQHVKYAPESGE